MSASATDIVIWWRAPGIYDLVVDTSVLSPAAAAVRIRDHLEHGSPPAAFARLAGGA